MDIVNLFRANAHIMNNYFEIPKVFSQVKPSDCSFESATSHLAQQLRLYRTNDVVGPKVLFYAYDSKKNEKMKETRELFFQFFKDYLGFSDDSIIKIELKEILCVINTFLLGKKYYNKFTQITRSKMTALATSIFQGFKETGYSKQLLTIGVTECEEVGSVENWLFSRIQNFELNIYISSKASENNARIYLDGLVTKIKQ